ncbi:MAG: nucleotidyltransferase family protein [Dehalococcoidia bacterium]|nr:nucleotidyltransferase family protein [Dehalococcoidia bacterium]
MQRFVSAVLTAAGLSSRMGRPKPLLPWRGKTLVESQIQSLLEAGANEVIVVLGHKAEQVAPYVSGKAVRDVMNPLYKEGRTSSIRAGLEAVSPDATDIVIMAVDQPRTPQIVSDVINAHLEAGTLLTSPRYRGRGGHPLIFSACLLPELGRISEENQGLREVFERHRAEINEVVFDDPAIRLDLNTPEAYDEAYEKYGREV